MKTNDYNLQYYSALGFYKNAIELAERINKNAKGNVFEIAPPAAVNLSFAIELLLKLIFNITQGEMITNEHRLDQIYSGLNEDVKEKIDIEFNHFKTHRSEKLSPIKLSFNTHQHNADDLHEKHPSDSSVIHLLKTHSNGFIKWRYLYEVEDKYYSYEFDFQQLNSFANALIKIINGYIKPSSYQPL